MANRTDFTALRIAAQKTLVAAQKALANAKRAEAAEYSYQLKIATKMNKAGCSLQAMRKECPMIANPRGCH